MLQVCGAVATEVLSGGRVVVLGPLRGPTSAAAGGTPNIAAAAEPSSSSTGGGGGKLLVGRLDSVVPSEPDQLPGPSSDLGTFATFWLQRGFTMEEAAALMGSHALMDKQVRVAVRDHPATG